MTNVHLRQCSLPAGGVLCAVPVVDPVPHGELLLHGSCWGTLVTPPGILLHTGIVGGVVPMMI